MDLGSSRSNIISRVVANGEEESWMLLYFLNQCSPYCIPSWSSSTSQNNKSQQQQEAIEQLQHTVIVPLSTWPWKQNQKSPKQNKDLPQKLIKPPPAIRKLESLSSLVDHVIFTLLQRRERNKHGGGPRYNHNLLCQGYAIANGTHHPPHMATATTMPAAGVVVVLQWNSQVEFVKTSAWGHALHTLVGDDLLRTLLLHTQLFVPLRTSTTTVTTLIDSPRVSVNPKPTKKKTRKRKQATPQSTNHHVFRGNYRQVTGPPLTTTSREKRNMASASSSTETVSCRGRKRKRPSHDDEANVQKPNLALLNKCKQHNLNPSPIFVPHVGLPKSHVLNHANVSPSLLLSKLLKLPLPTSGCGKKTKSSRSWKRFCAGGALDLCQELLGNHQKCDYARQLERSCPFPDWYRSQKQQQGGSVSASLDQVSASFVPSERVVSFVKSILTKVFPCQLWGAPDVLTCILNKAACWVQMRRKERFSAKLLLIGISITKVKWLFGNKDKKKVTSGEHERAKQYTVSLLTWLLQEFCLPLLRTCFHITESEFKGRFVLLYYRKPIWSLFSALSLQKLKKDQYQSLTLEETATRLSSQEMGLSRLRLVPKTTGVRPIAMQSVSATLHPKPRELVQSGCAVDEKKANGRKMEKETVARAVCERKPSTNGVLNDVFAVLRNQYQRDTSLFGSGMAGLHFFYPRYQRFVQERKRTGQKGKLSFASVDIQHCYDTINQDKLLQRIDLLLTENQYMLQRIGVMHGQKEDGEKKANLSNIATHSNVLFRQHCQVEPPHSFEPLVQVMQKMNEIYHNAIFRDSGNTAVMSKKRLMTQLSEHLMSHLLVYKGRFNECFLVQNKGIPQGSILSSLLCNIYYGSVVEKSMGLGDTSSGEQSSLLTRMVDDFLLISHNPNVLTKFIETMDAGDSELGVRINQEKTQVSTSVKFRCHADGTSKEIAPNEWKRFFPWCGMLFDVQTGEVRIDYSRFQGGKARDGLSVDCTTHEGVQLLTQLKVFVRPRCLPILYDSGINSWHVQCINFFQMLALAAIKLVSYLDSCQGMGCRITNASHFLECIDSTISFAASFVASRLAEQRANCALQPAVTKWLGWKAVHDVLRRHCSECSKHTDYFMGVVSRYLQEIPVPHEDLKGLAVRAKREMAPRKLLATTTTVRKK